MYSGLAVIGEHAPQMLTEHGSKGTVLSAENPRKWLSIPQQTGRKNRLNMVLRSSPQISDSCKTNLRRHQTLRRTQCAC